MNGRAAVALVLGMGLGGCGPTLASLQPAHVAPKGHAQVAAGFEVGIPTGTLARAVDAGQGLADRARTCNDQSCQPTAEERGRLFDAGVSLASSPLSYSQHFALSYAFADGADAGLRWAAGNWRAQGRYQPLHREDGPFDMVVGLGVARGTTGIPFGDALPVVKLDDFTRWSFDVPILIGTSRSWFHAWTGLKVAYSRFTTTMHLELPQGAPSVARFDGHGLYALAQGGFAVGYRHVFVALELTLGELFGRADATISTPGTTTGTRRTDLTGFVLYPALALIGEL